MKQKIRKLLSVLLITAIGACTLCACHKTATDEMTREENIPELKIGVAVLKPFFYKDENGNYTGIDAEIADETCEKAGYKPVFVEIPWDEKDEYLKDGTVDCLWNAFSEDGREDKYLWTEPYMESRLVVMVEEKCPDQNLKDLKSKGGIAVRAGSKAEEILLEDTENLITDTEKVYSCGSFQMAETAFIKGYAGALACHEAVLRQIMDEYPDTYRILDDTLMTVHLGVAFAKDDSREHCVKISDAIKLMKQNGGITDIEKKYNLSTSDTEEAEAYDKN